MKSIVANISCVGGCLSVVYGATWIHPAAPWIAGGVLAFTAGVCLIRLKSLEEFERRRKETKNVR